jgi:hypothetical protein
MSIVVYDIETDGYLNELTMMSVAWTYDLEKDEWAEWLECDTKELVHYLNTFDINVGHYLYGFDQPALEKLTGIEMTADLFDTLVAARLVNPDFKDHTLRTWGKRLGVLKGVVFDTGDEDVDIKQVFGVYTEELSVYCKDDVKVTIALLERLMKQYPDGLDAIDFNPMDWERWAP